MTAQQLKNSILQMAVQGKLVPQDPNDEPAIVLLERIRAEKEKLIKEGKIKPEKNPSVIFRGEDNLPYEKVGKNEPVCIAEEIPFDIPETWNWVRLKSIGENTNDAFADGPFGSNLKKEHYTEKKEVRLIQLSNIGEDGWRNENTKYTTYVHAQTLSRSMVKPGAIVIAKMMPAGRAIIVPPVEKDFILSSDAVKFVPHNILDVEYLLYAINSPTFKNQVVSETHGVTRIRTSLGKLQTYLLPIPPLEEQHRIVSQLKTIFPYIQQYESIEEKRIELNNLFPEMLKKSILQEAVMGKLVPQDPNDEPASVLLEKIRTEKDALIKAGKMKKDKHESFIYRRDNSHYEKVDGVETCIDDETPFEIPDTWKWARAYSIGSMIRGKGIKRTETVPKGIPCVRYGEIYTSYNISFSDAISFIDESLDDSCLHFSTGDVIFTLTGENKVDIAKAVAYLGKNKVAAGGDLAYWTAHGMNPLYLVYYMASPYCIERKRRIATGDIIVHISTDKVGSFLVPIPPLAEQERIVNAINRAFSKLSAL